MYEKEELCLISLWIYWLTIYSSFTVGGVVCLYWAFVVMIFMYS